MAQADTQATRGKGEMEHRKRLTNYVSAGLSRHEQEWGLNGFGDRKEFTVFTYVPTMVKSLLEHDEADVRWIHTNGDGKTPERVENIMDFEPTDDDVFIEGVSATVPVGVLSIKGSPRKRDTLGSVIRTPEDVERTYETIGDDGD